MHTFWRLHDVRISKWISNVVTGRRVPRTPYILGLHRLAVFTQPETRLSLLPAVVSGPSSRTLEGLRQCGKKACEA
jgi:hypothetical protein